MICRGRGRGLNGNYQGKTKKQKRTNQYKSKKGKDDVSETSEGSNNLGLELHLKMAADLYTEEKKTTELKVKIRLPPAKTI